MRDQLSDLVGGIRSNIVGARACECACLRVGGNRGLPERHVWFEGVGLVDDFHRRLLDEEVVQILLHAAHLLRFAFSSVLLLERGLVLFVVGVVSVELFTAVISVAGVVARRDVGAILDRSLHPTALV